MERVPCSTDYWFALVTRQKTGYCRPELERLMLRALKNEVPRMCSVTFERSCRLQCAHCIYPRSASVDACSRHVLPELVARAVEQLPGAKPRLLHEGRMLRPWHVAVMADAKRRRPGLKVGLIDNGSYVRHIEAFARKGLKLDWLDISVDGDEQIHNAQRRSFEAYRQATEGLARAREVTSGRVTSLFTLTSINHRSLESTARALFEPRGRDPLIDEMHVTTITPIKPHLTNLEQHDLAVFWRQAREIYARYGQADGRRRVFFRLYRHQELAKLARATSPAETKDALLNAQSAPGEVHFQLRGLPFIYAPLSIWPGETFLIDADGAYRTAYSIGETLADLQSGKNKEGEDLAGYTVEGHLKPDFDLARLYRRCVDQWWRFMGKKFFAEEVETVDKI